MYLTRAELARGPGAMQAWAGLLKESARFDQGHRLIWTLFARHAETKRSFLWREVDTGSYIILSREAPSDETSLWRLKTRAFAPELSVGDCLRFSLRANPAIAVRQPGQRGKRSDAVMHAKRPAAERAAMNLPSIDAEGREKAALDWLYAREIRLGVTFDRQRCSAGGYGVIRAGKGPTGDISFAAIDYEGVLEVADPALFGEALQNGIGKAKAYGCGLMLIRRV